MSCSGETVETSDELITIKPGIMQQLNTQNMELQIIQL